MMRSGVYEDMAEIIVCRMCKEAHQYQDLEYVRTGGGWSWHCSPKDSVEYYERQQEAYKKRDVSLDCNCGYCCQDDSGDPYDHGCHCPDELYARRKKDLDSIGYDERNRWEYKPKE
jgi:hypothetical protein